MKPCITCHNKPIKNGIYKAHLEHFAEKQLPPNKKHFHNKNSMKLKVKGLKPSSTIFYFATKSRDFTKRIQMRTKAYGNLSNSGVTHTNNKGEAIIYIKCPQLYKNDNGKVYSRHFHFLYWSEKNNRWNHNLYTQQVLCTVDKSFVKKHMKNAVIIDARFTKEYNQKHIEGAISVPFNKRYTDSDIFNKIKMSKIGKTNKMNNKLVPIIIYCSKGCNASKKLSIKLNKLGFYNIKDYENGLTDWNDPTISKNK